MCDKDPPMTSGQFNVNIGIHARQQIEDFCTSQGGYDKKVVMVAGFVAIQGMSHKERIKFFTEAGKLMEGG